MGYVRHSVWLMGVAGAVALGFGGIASVRAQAPTQQAPGPEISIPENFSYELGEDLFRRGNYGEAHDMWLDLALSGDRTSQFRLGALFFDGVVVPQDYARAAEWYIKAAEAGSAKAQLDLGTLYDMGAGVEQDLTKAAYWYMRAARQGEPAGQYNVAAMLEDGAGGAPDYAGSYFWYDLALRAGFVDLRGGSRERVAEQMTAADLLQAQRRASEWQPVAE